MDTLTDTQRPKRVGAVMAILGMWLKETNDDLTGAEKTRAKFHCRKRLREARAHYGGTPPLEVLFAIDEAVALDILAHRETMQALQRTSPMRVLDETPPELAGGQNGDTPGQDGSDSVPTRGQSKTKTPKASAARGRTTENDALYKAIEHARKARKDVGDLVGAGPKPTNKGNGCGISPEVLTMIDECDELMKEVYALGVKRNATYTGPPSPGAPIHVPDSMEDVAP
ncbi:MAG: hypothetical protein K1Y02_00070 [Candidatus Hydrogenedentes bacterium]|nr:hypothetical protein [Candidatus Hydrogenedentota bacterium]